MVNFTMWKIPHEMLMVVKIYKQDGHYTAILTTNNKLTFDEAQDVRSLKTAIQLLDIKE